jgi:2',3'-cyclic-nucleotide 2'-phosphodiesterase/3'-nucleotidase
VIRATPRAPVEDVPIIDFVNYVQADGVKQGLTGADAHLTYDVDLAQPAGSRIVDLKYGDNPVSTTAEFALAVNNYRQSGGGGFPAVKTAPVLYSNSTDIRQLLIDWVGTHHVIDPTQFASVDWRLVANGEALTIT